MLGVKGTTFSRSLVGRLGSGPQAGSGRGITAHAASNLQVPSSGTLMSGGSGIRPNIIPPLFRPNSGHTAPNNTMGTSQPQTLSSFRRGGGYQFTQ